MISRCCYKISRVKASTFRFSTSVELHCCLSSDGNIFGWLLINIFNSNISPPLEVCLCLYIIILVALLSDWHWLQVNYSLSRFLLQFGFSEVVFSKTFCMKFVLVEDAYLFWLHCFRHSIFLIQKTDDCWKQFFSSMLPLVDWNLNLSMKLLKLTL